MGNKAWQSGRHFGRREEREKSGRRIKEVGAAGAIISAIAFLLGRKMKK